MNKKAGNATPSSSELKKIRLQALDRKQSGLQQRQQSAASSPRTVFSSPKTPLRTPLKTSLPPNRRRLSASSGTSVSNVSAEPAYAQLPDSIFTGELASHLQLARTDGKQTVSSILTEIWSRDSKVMKDLDNTIDKAVSQVLLLDNPTTHQMYLAKARARAQQNSKRSSRRLSRRKHRKLGSFRLDPEYAKYDLFLPLHDMWKEYIASLIAGCNDSMIQTRILTAELHGAPMEVVDSKSGCGLGTKGLMIRETENTFAIITQANEFKVVPKRGSIFMVQLDAIKVMLFGNNLSLRSMQDEKRASKKLKPTIEL